MSSTHLPAVPGLLLECSPVRFGGPDGPNGIVASTPKPGADLVLVTFVDSTGLHADHTSFCELAHLELRLDQETGRVHAAWWAMFKAQSVSPIRMFSAKESHVHQCVAAGLPVTDPQIATLHALVTRLNEETP